MWGHTVRTGRRGRIRVFILDADPGAQEHVVRIHTDSPDDEWKNLEMTGINCVL